MAHVFGKATNDGIASLREQGYNVEVGPFEKMEGFYGNAHEQAENQLINIEREESDIRVWVDADPVSVLHPNQEKTNICVIEIRDGIPYDVKSFIGSRADVVTKAAEKAYVDLIKKYGFDCDYDTIEDYLDDGSMSGMNFSIAITHPDIISL